MNMKFHLKKNRRCNNSQCLSCTLTVIISVVCEHIKNDSCFSAGHKRADNGEKMHLFSQYATEQKNGKVFINRIDVYWFQPTLHAQHGNQTHTLRGLTIRRRRPVRHIFLWWRKRFGCLLLTKIKVFHPSHKR